MRALDIWLRSLDAENAAPQHRMDNAWQRALTLAGLSDLETGYGVIDRAIRGSVYKGTATAFVLDLDLYLYIDAAAWRSTRGTDYAPITVLTEFEARLNQYYARYGIQVRRQRRSLRVCYAGDQLDIDVVPLLVRKSTRLPLIGDKSDGWLPTSLDRQSDYFDDNNKNQRLAQFIRLMKLWRVACKSGRKPRWGSYLIEVLGHWVCSQPDAARRGSGLFRQFLQRVADGELRDGVVLKRWTGRRTRAPGRGRKALYVLDPAIPEHNLTTDMTWQDRDAVERDARDTLAVFDDIRLAIKHADARWATASLKTIWKPSKRYRGRALRVPDFEL